MTRTATHTLTTRQNRTFRDDAGMWEAVETLTVGGMHYSVGGWDATTEQRTQMGGPLVPGPQVYTFGDAIVIAAVALPETRTFVKAALGDLVVVDGYCYRIVAAPNRNIDLVPVD